MNYTHTAPPQNWALLLIYQGYRALLALLLLLMFVLTVDQPILGQTNILLFLISASLYALFAIALLAHQLMRTQPATSVQIFTGFFIDVVALAFITQSSGGIGSGLELLLVITIAAANMLLMTRLGILLAALASLAAISSTLYLVLIGESSSQQFLPSGLLGLAFFMTAIAIQYLTQRIVTTQKLAETRKADVQHLLQINQSIVQKMQTGIVVMNREGNIRLINAAGANLLGLPYHHNTLPQTAPDELIRLCQHYQGEPLRFRLKESGPDIQVNLTSVDSESEGEYLLYLDDMRKLSQQAQQLKLASLGQFTASIAHEIRNPLGAMSHAAQLLRESEDLPKADVRLADIICNHAGRMNRIIENILQLSRRGDSRPEYFELHDWLTQFINEYQEDQDATLLLEADSQPYDVQVDPSQLQQILNNIVGNGLYYSKQKTGEAKITLRLMHSIAADAPILDIIDYGPGISEDNQQRIFEPFFTTRNRGTGLGLYIAREMSEANQIYLGYFINKEGESCFRLQFTHPKRRSLLDT